MVWTDPATGESFIVDTGTGNSRPVYGPEEGEINASRRTLVAREKDRAEQDGVPSWIGEALTVRFRLITSVIAGQNFLQANEVYVRKEKPIPTVPCSDAFISDMRHYELQKQLHYKQSASQVINSSNRFSRDDLKEASVINQVDSKFIACLLPSDPTTGDAGYGSVVSSQAFSRTLALVDQHAADERIRVEWLQREICLGYLRDDGIGVERTILDPPVPILLTRHEKQILRRSGDIKDLFASWGVEFAPISDVGKGADPDDDDNYSQVTMTSIPEIVSHRVCVNFAPLHFDVDRRASYHQGTTCSISSRVCSEITRMTPSEGRPLHLSHYTAKMNSRGKEL